MRKIITSGLTVQYNFGCPSILYGAYELLRILYDNEFTMINYQNTEPTPSSIHDMEFRTIAYCFSKKKFINTFLKACLRLPLPDHSLGRMIREVKEANLIVDLYGICFCYDLEKREMGYLRSMVSLLNRFMQPFVAKCFRVRTAKNTASYGPIVTKTNKRMAVLACKYLFLNYSRA